MTKPENLRLLDADEEGADWREVARIVLHIARQAFESHLAWPNDDKGTHTGTGFDAAGLAQLIRGAEREDTE